MATPSILQMSHQVAALMETRLGARGRDLPEKLKRSGNRLPRRVRQAAAILAEAGQLAANPKLQARLDEARAAQAYDICLRHLSPLGRRARRLGYVLDLAATAALAVLVAGAGIIAFMVWKGYV